MDVALFVVDEVQTIFKGWHVDLDIKIRVLVVISDIVSTHPMKKGPLVDTSLM